MRALQSRHASGLLGRLSRVQTVRGLPPRLSMDHTAMRARFGTRRDMSGRLCLATWSCRYVLRLYFEGRCLIPEFSIRSYLYALREGYTKRSHQRFLRQRALEDIQAF